MYSAVRGRRPALIVRCAAAADAMACVNHARDTGTGPRKARELAMSEELWRLGATALAGKIASREISSREAVAAHLARIGKVNPAVNAITVVMTDEAMAAAAAADQRIASGEPAGPLHGVPFTVKENLDVAGSATTSGVAALRDNVAPADTPAVARLRSAGAIPIARTNLPDFALRAHTGNTLRGATLNPWNPALTPGGSSGGEAVALATGMSPLGLGNDVGGSLRMPAQFNGVCGLKPSSGCVPWWNATDPGTPLFVQLMAVHGPMARSVADLRAALAVISGSDPRDPWSLPRATPTAAHHGDRPPAVAFVAEPEGGATHPDVSAGVRRAAGALADAGYAVEEVAPPPITAAFEVWSQIIWTGVNTVWPLMGPLMSEEGRAFVEYCFDRWPPLDRDRLAAAWPERLNVARAWAMFQADYPLVLGPAFTHPPFEVGFDVQGADEAAETSRRMRLLTVANVAGLPAVTVPAGSSADLPQGVQVIGPYLGEDLCLAAGAAIEERLGTLTPVDPA